MFGASRDLKEERSFIHDLVNKVPSQQVFGDSVLE